MIKGSLGCDITITLAFNIFLKKYLIMIVGQ